MILPPTFGQNTQTDFYIYAACNSDYFDQFAHQLVNSIIKNTNQGVHLHLFNPREDQIAWCNQPRVSATWEYIDHQTFDKALSVWQNIDEDQKKRTQTAMTKGGDTDVRDRLMRTYFACARFIRLSEQFSIPTLAIDIDAIVRFSIPGLDNSVDFYLHRIFGKKARCLAGGLYLHNKASTFLNEYSNQLTQKINQDYIYWGMDQDLLDIIVPKYHHGQLPESLIDWHMRDDSCIWTAKGTRKDLDVFVNEQKKYNF